MAPTDADVAVAAAVAGAEVVRRRFGTESHRHVEADTDFATDVDIDAEVAIRNVVRAARPQDGFVSEELGACASGDRTWLADPLCGTLNSAVRTPLVAVNIALRAGDRMAAVTTVDPFTRETFWTDGDGAWLRHGDTEIPLAPSADSALVDLNLDAPPDQAHRTVTVRMLASPMFAKAYGLDHQEQLFLLIE